MACLGVEVVVSSQLDGQRVVFVPSTEQNILYCLGLANPRPFNLQKIAQDVSESPLHENVGGLIQTGASTERGGVRVLKEVKNNQ